MSSIRLSGQLICSTVDEVLAVTEHLPLHQRLSRAEPGCLEFSVQPTSDPLVWQVDELFIDLSSFESHQRRVRLSLWGRATEGIERRYFIEKLD